VKAKEENLVFVSSSSSTFSTTENNVTCICDRLNVRDDARGRVVRKEVSKKKELPSCLSSSQLSKML